MDINLRDYFKIDDSHSKIRGFLIVKDEDGNILVKKENMIVKGGRRLILNAITGGTALDLSNVTAKISEDATLTNSEMDKMEDLCEDASGNNSWTITSEKDPNELVLKYSFSVEGFKQNYNANSLGLFYGDTLFSRVVFNTIGLSANRTVTFNYYIYF